MSDDDVYVSYKDKLHSNLIKYTFWAVISLFGMAFGSCAWSNRTIDPTTATIRKAEAEAAKAEAEANIAKSKADDEMWKAIQIKNQGDREMWAHIPQPKTP